MKGVIIMKEKGIKEEYKVSLYNNIIDLNDGGVGVFNSFSGRLVKIDSEYDDVADMLKSGVVIDDERINYDFLEKNNLIVYSDIDEISKVRLFKMQELMDNVLGITIYSTYNCNFRCRYCYETHSKEVMNEQVQDDLVNFVNKNISKYSAVVVSWFGGEPLLTTNLIDSVSKRLIEICKKNKKPYMANMTTNGYNLSLEVFKRMLKNHVYSYQITIDGAEDNHNFQRPHIAKNDSYSRIINNLKDIRDNVKSNLFNIIIRCNVSKKVMNNIDEYIDTLKREFSGDKRFNCLWRPASDWGGDEVKDFIDNICTMQEMQTALEIGREAGLDFFTHFRLMQPGGSVCYASRKNYFAIGTDGKVYKCTGQENDDINNVGVLKDGDMILDDNKVAKWTAASFDAAGECEKCSYYPSCLNATCPTRILIMDEKKCCGHEKENIEVLIKLFCNSNDYVIPYFEKEAVS